MPNPPRAQKIPKSSTLHGDARVDDYFWLRDRNSPEVTSYLEAENDYTQEMMKDTEELQQTLYDEMVARTKEDDASVPARKADYYYYTRREKGQNYAIHCRKQGSLDAEEEIILDENELAQEHDYFRVGIFSVSPDHNTLAYSVDTNGGESYALRFKDLSDGRDLAEIIEDTYYSFSWGNDNRTVFYTRIDAAHRPDRLFRHELGTDPSDDVLVFQEKDDAFFDKALEGFAMFALNQGEVCTCPSRALVQRSMYSDFVGDAVTRVEKIIQGNPLDDATMIGAQASSDQLEKILSYIDIGKAEGAKVLTGGERTVLEGDLAEGYYVQPTIFEGSNSMRIFQEEIFGPVVSLTSFDDEADALKIANDTLYGLGAGVWSRDGAQAFRAGKEIKAGRVWTNCYHAYPAHAAFGGYKQSGIGRENHKMMLDHYQQTKNLLVSYSPDALGFF